ncbi:hypothetical protein [Mucilaginibacter sp. KACC 22063]|uniref:hypothetical protein n=1 Tax=Mucilaginibacter sp. KACC 22063 TaxID=3025666 RepID=UPI002365275B|nr:hypothetical protein [Mucilaginibacter sp. KACC 22063]WDF56897.1 hypothetical protein PQ461_07490 [Mucilaginibacter sp. KACC 22063]
MNEQFKKHLFDVAATRIRQRGMPVPLMISELLRETINTGVTNMSESELNDTSKRQLAEKNLLFLVDSMIQRSLYEGLQTRTFSNARKSICPLWPFC